MKGFEIVENNLAPKGLRLANYIIDLIAFYIFMFIFMATLGFFLGITGNESLVPIFEDVLLVRLLIVVFYVVFMLTTEAAFGGKSIGKIITGTKVVTEYGEKPTIRNFAIRNLYRLVPFDMLSFLDKVGWHDKWSNTRVVKTKSFDFEMLNNGSIDDIGAAE
ncbi:MAG: RDD family protein [Flavobacteriaceae bacterium]|jgi:uncharacterized RDD family membrane protein YckC|nr:RDD family protein [Flavobacteriaceae bacterium]